MKLYSPVILPFAEILQKYTEEQMSIFNTEILHVQNISISESDRKQINEFLNSKNISNLKNILAFKRKMQYIDYTDCHLDVDPNNLPGLINCSIVIPVSGCRYTKQYWYTGDFKYRLTKTPSGADYAIIDWNGSPVLTGEVEIYKQPVLVRTDIPHSAYSMNNEYRLTCTIRFTNNETFEYLEEQLSI